MAVSIVNIVIVFFFIGEGLARLVHYIDMKIKPRPFTDDERYGW
jgi:hypothetical protein